MEEVQKNCNSRSLLFPQNTANSSFKSDISHTRLFSKGLATAVSFRVRRPELPPGPVEQIGPLKRNFWMNAELLRLNID